jgi:hypothetical protein
MEYAEFCNSTKIPQGFDISHWDMVLCLLSNLVQKMW